jgi:hypothetical protein
MKARYKRTLHLYVKQSKIHNDHVVIHFALLYRVYVT